MTTNEEIKDLVKKSYTKAAEKTSPCCQPEQKAQASSCCGGNDTDIAEKDRSNLKGYNPDADLGLGCGIPTAFAKIKEGDTVLDLGSGAGNDVFIVRAITGDSGRVIGVDFTEAMIDKANKNNSKQGYKNVEFRLGDIENLPVESNSVDVTISNCVLNLVPDKKKAFAEIYRTLKPGGHFSVSDIVIKGSLSEKVKKVAELYAGCISGAVDLDEYLGIIKESGFINVKVLKEKDYLVHDSLLLDYISPDELKQFRNSGTKILSVTVYAEK